MSASGNSSESGPKLLAHALQASAGDVQRTARLLSDRRRVNEADEQGLTALHYAVGGGGGFAHALQAAANDVQRMERLLSDHRRRVNVCAMGGDLFDAVRLLLACEGVEVNKGDVGGRTALHHASMFGHRDVVRLLIARQDVDVNKATTAGSTALHIASEFGNGGVVRLLLESQDIDVNKASLYGRTALHVASQEGRVDVVQLLLAHKDVEVNKSLADGHTALIFASQAGHIEVVRLLLACEGVDVNKVTTGSLFGTALQFASESGHVDVIRLLLAFPGIDAGKVAMDGRTALSAALQRGHDAIVRLVVAHSTDVQMLQLAADAADSLPGGLLSKLPGVAVAAQAAALCLPLCAAAALGDTEEERAAADLLASQSDTVRQANRLLAIVALKIPQEYMRAREAHLAHAPAQSPSDAAAHAVRERKADAELRAATTTAAFRLAQHRQLTVRNILWSREEELARGEVGDAFAARVSLNGHSLQQFKLEQAESACRFALRHNGQPSCDRLRGPTRALAAAIKVVVDARDERRKRALAAATDKVERAERELASGLTSMSISLQSVAFAGAAAEADTTTSAASPSSSGCTTEAGEERRCACPGCHNGRAFLCGACKGVGYCSRACQKLQWPAHKAGCKAKRGEVKE
jgi:ankyrin repeat protein